MNATAVRQTAAILIVDDDPIVRALMRAALEDEGFAVSEAEDGEEARHLCETCRPDLVIVDAVMPRMDGYEFCRQLRQPGPLAYVPILMATSLDDMPSIARAYEAGATDFIAKPLKWMILNHRVRYMLRAARAFAELRENQDRLVASKEAAEAANRSKTEFLSNMSHELRTPLNAIIGFSAIMRDGTFGALSERYQDYARLIGDSGSHLLAIINDILEFAKADANRLVLAETPVEIAKVVALSIGITAEMARDSGVECLTALDDDLPILRGDEVKLRQILINLLSNAVKFTNEGGRVLLSVARASDGGVLFRIEDNGIGIAADKMAVALAPFGQIDSGLNRRYEGVGLGLPLTKRLIELHDGAMEIESTPGSGTIVTARFPATRLCDERASSDGQRRLAALSAE